MAIGLILIWLFFSFATDNFLSSRNLSLLSIELAITATLALGMLLVLLPGYIDLSVGSGVGLIGGIATVLIFHYEWNAVAAMLTGLAVAVGLWCLMGSIITKQRVPAFIITLGGLLVFKGLFWKVIQSETVPVTAGDSANAMSLTTTYYLPETAGFILLAIVTAFLIRGKLRERAQRAAYGFEVEPKRHSFLKVFVAFQVMLLCTLIMNQYRGIPLSVVILGAVAFGVFLLTRHTRFGRYLYAIGGNKEAAVLSGIPVDKVVITAYAILGGIVALSGFMQTAYSGNSTTTIGNLMELDAIAACVIGGTSLAGGRGNVLGVLVGALIMASLLNGMTLMSVDPSDKFIARGLVLAVAVWLDVYLSRKK
ncbi:amino acid or sugar ABC transport system, permease protein, putative [Verrucomicrobiia bacterium DG1235]|nr:amino acid or sugar ABC transport system, permease protein, putative [Verrucomicrobiae bacterium DG1235]